EGVLVAVDLVLDTGHPSAEHVLNVLARLSEGPPPEAVSTSLTVSEPPTTDTSRYDTLREELTHVCPDYRPLAAAPVRQGRSLCRGTAEQRRRRHRAGRMAAAPSDHRRAD